MLRSSLNWLQDRLGRRRAGRSHVFIGAVTAVGLMAGLTWLPSTGSSASLVIAAEYRADPAVLSATQELSQAMATYTGSARPRLFGLIGGSSPKFSAVAGDAVSREVREVVLKHRLALPELGEEGYVIYPLPQSNSPRVLVVGKNALGIAYGVLALAEDLRLERPYLRYPLPLHREPAMDFRLVSDPIEPAYPDPELALRWGYNAVMAEPWPALALYERFDPALYDLSKYPQARAWVEERRRLTRERLARAKALHLKVLLPGDVLSFPSQVLALYGREVSDGGALPRYCIERPKVRELLVAALDEVFVEFPEIDGIMVRTGENYPLGHLNGNTPQEARCRSSGDGQESLAMTLRFLHEQVVNKHHKLLIQRLWDLGSQGNHAQSNGAQRLVAASSTQQPSLYSFKISATDFWRYNRLNPNLMQLTIPRMIELQAAREYEGKGAFPNYVAAVYGLGPPEVGGGGLQEAYASGVRWAWVWAKGGGWGGPVLKSDLWLDANIYALSHLLWDVAANPKELAERWAGLRFGAAAAPHIAALLEKSPEATLKGLYVRCYATKNSPWTPNLLWVRDDVISGHDKMLALYQACASQQDFTEALQEKRQALALVDGMVTDFWRAQPFIRDKGLQRITLASLQYQLSLFETLQHYLTGMFYFYRFQDSDGKDQEAKTTALQAFTQLQESWLRHIRGVPQLPEAPTPYRDAGMLATIGAAQRVLEGR